MKNKIREVKIKDIPELLEEQEIWSHDFIPVTKHRLYSQYLNPLSSPEDTVLLLAYAEGEIVGYMGLFNDYIQVNSSFEKIGWLSTWWVHPKTKGTGIGRNILNTMYELQRGRIGISQFTPSAKRVYDKSGFFNTLKTSKGIKFVLRSNLNIILPLSNPRFEKLKGPLKTFDLIINLFLQPKLWIQNKILNKRMFGLELEYVNKIDNETELFLKHCGKDHLAPRDGKFFNWLKSYHWVLDAPLTNLTNNSKYNFSNYDSRFDIYLIKIKRDEALIGFIVLQLRDKTIKVLYTYYQNYFSEICDIIISHGIELNASQIICYDPNICLDLNHSFVKLYSTKKIKESIISKNYPIESLELLNMNFGDGDCSFA